jgi:CheY-like chemotaxis protein
LSKPQRTRILVVDDEKNITNSLVWILEGAGFEAAAAYDALGALERIEQFPPDIVISDVIMPGMNGIELCEIIHGKYPQCQILLFSGQTATNELLENARKRGLRWDLLAKPVEPEEILARVASLGETGN